MRTRQYNMFRWYRAGWGRYSQADPIGVGGPLFSPDDPIVTTDAYGYAEANPLIHTDPTGRSVATSEGASAAMQIGGALYDFLRRYRDTRQANTIDADKYFHCMANCEAARRGPYGATGALVMSIAREAFDSSVKGDSAAACMEDMVANLAGVNGGTACNSCAPPSPCKRICKSFRPRALDPRY
jgi:RHS repeat-associated protein